MRKEIQRARQVYVRSAIMDAGYVRISKKEATIEYIDPRVYRTGSGVDVLRAKDLEDQWVELLSSKMKASVMRGRLQ